MCEPTLDDIEKVCGVTYIKGIKPNVFVSSAAKITAIAAPTSGTLNVASVTFASGAAWYTWNISKIDGSYKADATGDVDNPTIAVSVEAFIYGITSERTYTVNQTLGHDFIVVVSDNNGNNRLIGEVGRGCTITVNEQTNDKNGYKVTITWEAGHYPYFFTGTLPS